MLCIMNIWHLCMRWLPQCYLDEEKIFLARQLVKQGVGGVSLGDTDVTDSRSLPPGTSEEREEEEDLEVPSEPEVAGQ